MPMAAPLQPERVRRCGPGACVARVMSNLWRASVDASIAQLVWYRPPYKSRPNTYKRMRMWLFGFS